VNNDWIDIKNVYRHYCRGQSVVKALDGVSLAIGQGEFVALAGASGSGKSTLLNLIAGLDTPTDGSINFAGRNLGDLPARELARFRAERIGMVFQAFNLLPQHTALRNVEMALYFNRRTKTERRHIATDLMTRLGLADRLYHRPADLSGGEQQRVAFARALVKNPEILLADEPTGNLDKENSELIFKLMSDCHKQGQTIIMVTHDIASAERVAGRIIKLSYGRVESGI
jgi:putative ABC transport system ATP-binding protein